MDAIHVGVNGAINPFLKAFPEGFRDPSFWHRERDYKITAHGLAKERLCGGQLSERVRDGDFPVAVLTQEKLVPCPLHEAHAAVALPATLSSKRRAWKAKAQPFARRVRREN